MRQGSNPRRSRGRGPRKPHNPSRPQGFDGGGGDVRVRGNAYQVMEKYLQLARDASAAGDRIAMENFLQHAEHYYRVLNANGEANRPRQGFRNDVNGNGVATGNGFDAQPGEHGQQQPGEQRNAMAGGDNGTAKPEEPDA